MNPHKSVVIGSIHIRAGPPRSALVLCVQRLGLFGEYNFKITTTIPCKALKVTNQLEIDVLNCKEYLQYDLNLRRKPYQSNNKIILDCGQA